MHLKARIDHVGIVVQDLEQALEAYQLALGLSLQEIADLPDQKVRVAFLPVGESSIELVQPVTEESGVAQFLEKHGEGFHHICLQVEDIDAILEQLSAYDVPLIDQQSRPGAHGRIAFVHPRGMHGVLIELVQHTESNAGGNVLVAPRG